MADEKLVDLTELTSPTGADITYVVDKSDTTQSPEGTSKKMRLDAYSNPNGVARYDAVADLPATGVETTSYKVTADPTPANNGFYTWTGATYTQDSGLYNGAVASGETDAVDGDTVYDYIEALNIGDGAVVDADTDTVSGDTVYDALLLIYKDSGVLLQEGNVIPSSSDALFWLDGTISGNYFLDKSGSERHFLITGNDFPSDWVSGFPYKSGATISAPAGDATLIAADINNFLYDSGGTPNEIYVVSLFQNIDYEDKLFVRHSAQVLNPTTGVETSGAYVRDIVLYAGVKTGFDLARCNGYYGVPTEQTSTVKWVSKAGNDSNAGTKAAPWLTLQKANNSATIGDRIYIKTGVFAEEKSGSLTQLWSEKTIEYFSLGGVSIQATAGVFGIRVISNNPTFTGVVFDGESARSNLFDMNAAGGVKVTTVTRCLFKGSTSFNIDGNGTDNTCNVIDSVLLGDKTVLLYNDCTISGNYIEGATTIVSATDVSALNNRIISDTNTLSAIQFSSMVGAGTMTVTDNNIITKGSAINFNSVTSGLISANAKYNDIEVIWTTESASTFTGILCNAEEITPTLEYNTINLSTADVTDNCYAVYVIDGVTPTVQYNIITMESKLQNIALQVNTHALYSTGAIKFNYNRITSNSTAGIDVAFGGETTELNRFNNSECIGNRYLGYARNYPLETGVTVHGFLLNSGINFDIRDNYISDTLLGMVVKTGAQDTYTANGVYYNLFENCQRPIWIRGVVGLKIYGNTMINTDTVTVFPFNGIVCDENAPNPGNYCEDIIIKNNIIWNTVSVPTIEAIQLDAHAAANGCLADYNIISDTVNKAYQFGAVSYDTVALAQAAGLMLNSDNTDPILTGLIPISGGSSTGAGQDLGASYDDGLDTTTDWGSTTQVPTIVEKAQPTNWDIGAYIH